MSSIFCSHGEYLHPWDCDICEGALDASVGDIVIDPPTLLEVLGWD